MRFHVSEKFKNLQERPSQGRLANTLKSTDIVTFPDHDLMRDIATFWHSIQTISEHQTMQQNMVNATTAQPNTADQIYISTSMLQT